MAERVSHQIKHGTVSFEDSPALRDAVFNRILSWFLEHECFSGEGVMQCDAPQLTAAPMLADIADELFRFTFEWKDDD
jgi:hypothetical protein